MHSQATGCHTKQSSEVRAHAIPACLTQMRSFSPELEESNSRVARKNAHHPIRIPLGLRVWGSVASPACGVLRTSSRARLRQEILRAFTKYTQRKWVQRCGLSSPTTSLLPVLTLAPCISTVRKISVRSSGTGIGLSLAFTKRGSSVLSLSDKAEQRLASLFLRWAVLRPPSRQQSRCQLHHRCPHQG